MIECDSISYRAAITSIIYGCLMHKVTRSILLSFWQYLSGFGLPESEAECHDVYGLDDELLEMVPKPVLAVLFLYPITAKVFQNAVCFSIDSHTLLFL